MLTATTAAPWDRAEFAAWGVHVPDYRGPTLAERYAAATAKASGKPIRPPREFSVREWRAADAALSESAQQRGRQRVELDGRTLAASASPDSELRQLAGLRAELLGQRIDAIDRPHTPDGLLDWLNAQVDPLQGRPFAFEGERPHADQLRGFLARARCAMWWRRCLRRAAVRLREAEGRAAGEVCATRRQPYVTTDTLRRHAERRAANAAMMAATELENEAGQVFNLAELAAASTSNKAIRRGELMTRITGCERLAELFGMRGVFLTLTAPSRFHSVHRHGGRNEKHDGSTPKDAHAWLCATWAKARSALQRRGIAPFGFRVAEPHHDGTPHWHGLLWVKPGQVWRLVRLLKRWWLADDGGERGARQHRVEAIMMNSGGASGYIAKYIAKNIDDAGAVGAEGHRDDDTAAGPQGELFGGTAQRVEAWASAWGIRQFQAIGQPPVTVWRELRRVPELAQGGATERLAHAFTAVNRAGARRADWALYVIAQGGLHLGRKYLLRLATAEAVVHGRYESIEKTRPVGVIDSTGPGEVHHSARSEWRPRGEWGARSAPAVHPWTRVNNCTQARGLRPLFGAITRRFLDPGEGQNNRKDLPHEAASDHRQTNGRPG